MARDARGRFLPGPDDGDGRHVLSRAEKQKGYLVATQMTRMPSRLRAWLRKKIRNQYVAREAARRGRAG
jgi:hypothetical protein